MVEIVIIKWLCVQHKIKYLLHSSPLQYATFLLVVFNLHLINKTEIKTSLYDQESHFFAGAFTTYMYK